MLRKRCSYPPRSFALFDENNGLSSKNGATGRSGTGNESRETGRRIIWSFRVLDAAGRSDTAEKGRP